MKKIEIKKDHAYRSISIFLNKCYLWKYYILNDLIE